MKAFFVVAAVLAAVASANAKATYDCSHKPDGNYVHPTDCTRFMSCSGGVASQRDCALCHVDARRCPDGRLVYNATLDACLWADETRCETGGGDDSSEESEESGEDNSPTDGPNPDPTGAPNPDPERPVEGQDCNPEECMNDGYCQHYLRCDKGTKKWVREECGENLVWNPLFANGTNQVHGGNCDVWDNLSAAVERTYRTDEDCLACFWRSLGDCSRDYDYQAPNGTHRNVLRLSCAEGLVFSQEKETCQRCEDVIISKDGSTSNCCGV